MVVLAGIAGVAAFVVWAVFFEPPVPLPEPPPQIMAFVPTGEEVVDWGDNADLSSFFVETRRENGETCVRLVRDGKLISQVENGKVTEANAGK